jgi:hypothetical protein
VAPADAPNDAVQALAELNATRVAAGSGCINEIAALNKSALNHCNYYVTNSQNATCIADPHGEVSSCEGFTGASVGAREIAAGYSNPMGGSEVMAFYGNPKLAVATWINSVWHRLPILDPWTTDMGYGGATRCDVIDFGRGTTLPPATVVVIYPYDGQTGVPPSFDGSREGPEPPAPTSGWPSGYPVSVHAQSISVTEHILTKDGDSTPIEHVWLDSTSTTVDAGLRGALRSTVFMYGNAPLAANTKYRVKVTGTHNGGALNLEWTFTTGASNPWGF